MTLETRDYSRITPPIYFDLMLSPIYLVSCYQRIGLTGYTMEPNSWYQLFWFQLLRPQLHLDIFRRSVVEFFWRTNT